MRSALSPFASAAAELARRGLTPIPVGGEGGKKPLVKWPHRRLAPDSPAIKRWAEKFANANVGILTKPSGVTIIDVDVPGLLSNMEERFGATPLVTRTPSGGGHLWYLAQGEGSRNLRHSEGLPVDVKAGGSGPRGALSLSPPQSGPAVLTRVNPIGLSEGRGTTLDGCRLSRPAACPARQRIK
jgi:hypothetical protein